MRDPAPVAAEARCGGIVQLGLGDEALAGFVALVDAARAGTAGTAHAEQDWGVIGIGLAGEASRVAALAADGGHYALTLHGGPDGPVTTTVTALARVVDAVADPAAALSALTDPALRILAFAPRIDDPDDLAHDLGHPLAPRSAVGLAAHALQRRRRMGRRGCTLLATDDAPATGEALRARLHAFAEALDPALPRWIDAQCTFPNGVMDRAAWTVADGASQAASAPRLVLAAEARFAWRIEDRFAAGRPDLSVAGVQVVPRIAPWVRVRQRLGDAALSALAWLGLAAGFARADEALACPELRDYVDALLRDELVPALKRELGETVDLQAARTEVTERLSAPVPGRLLAAHAADGSRRLPQQLLPAVRERLAREAPCDRLALAVAAWLQHAGGVDAEGSPRRIDDPLAGRLRALYEGDQPPMLLPGGEDDETLAARTRRLLGLAEVFGDLGTHEGFVAAVTRQALLLERGGARKAARAAAGKARRAAKPRTAPAGHEQADAAADPG